MVIIRNKTSHPVIKILSFTVLIRKKKTLLGGGAKKGEGHLKHFIKSTSPYRTLYNTVRYYRTLSYGKVRYGTAPSRIDIRYGTGTGTVPYRTLLPAHFRTDVLTYGTICYYSLPYRTDVQCFVSHES